MELSDAQLDRLDRYLMGQLRPEEVAQLEAELAQSVELQEALALQKRIQAGFARLGEQELKKKMSRIQQEVLAEAGTPIAAETPTRRLGWGKWAYAIAAGIVLLVAIWLIRSDPKPDQQEMYASLVNEMEISHLKGDPTQDSSWVAATALADAQQWTTAADAFAVIATGASEMEGQARINAGICYLKADAFAQTIKVLAPARDMTLYADQASWITALAYLGRNQGDDLQQSQQTLRALIEQVRATDYGGKLRKQAMELLEVLEMMK